MADLPSSNLMQTLAGLNLAGPRELARAAPCVRRLARGVPAFDSVWIDALARCGIITAFQAGELHAGRGDRLRIGPYLVAARMTSYGCGTSYLAYESPPRANPDDQAASPVHAAGSAAVPRPHRHRRSHKAVRLVAWQMDEAEAQAALTRLKPAIDAAATLGSAVCLPRRAGYDGDRIWAVGRHVEGEIAATWLAEFGRFPPEAVLEIARQLATQLAILEKAGLVHGEITAHQLLIQRSGHVLLPMAAWRAAVRPTESFAATELPAEAYDGLAPERLAHGTPPTIASELYALGALLWQLAVGRSPLPGGSSLAKLRAAQTGNIPDVRRLAPQLPEVLAETMARMLAMEPTSRPTSFAEVARAVGPSTSAGQTLLRRCLRYPMQVAPRSLYRPMRAPRRRSSNRPALAVAAGLVILLIGWWFSGDQPRGNTSIAQNETGLGSPPTQHSGATPGQPPAANRDGQESIGTPGPSTGGNVDARLVSSHAEDRIAGGAAGPGDSLRTVVLPPGTVNRLRPGELDGIETVRAESGRAVVELPLEGLVIEGSQIQFEGIDFVWPPAGSEPLPGTQSSALLILRVESARFIGCRFRAFGKHSATAIRWQGGLAGGLATLPTGHLEINRSVLENVTGVQVQTYGAMSIRATGTLHLGPGPLVQLTRCPGADEPLAVNLERSTIRGANAVLECRYRKVIANPAAVSLESRDSVFAGDGALLAFEGPDPSEDWLPAFRWRGQGSVLEDRMAELRWRDPRGTEQPLDNARLSIEGLVRSALEFAGPPGAGPAASRLIRCQAPLRSAELPGIQGSALPYADQEAP